MKSNFLKRALSIGLCATLVVGAAAISAYAADDPATGDGKYVYGKVNLPYADFYYGELNNVEESAELQLDAEDKAAALRGDGVLDAVSSATTNKWKSYPTTYTSEHENGDGGGYIYGIASVSVAIPTSLYNELKNTAEGTESKNSVLEIFSGFTPNEVQTAPTEYKVLNGDGTLTEMKDSAEKIKVDLSDSLVMQNNTRYGHYEFDIEDDNLPDRADMDGVVFEAKDSEGNVAKYATLHSDNLWFRTGHIAFAVKDGFLVHDSNVIKYKHFADLQGKTITKVTYIVRGGADVEYTTDLYCKYILEKGQGYTTEDAPVYADGAQAKFVADVPEDASYELASVSYEGNALTADTDFTYADDTFTVKDTENTGVGTYTLTYSSKKYADSSVSVQFLSSMTADQIKIDNNAIVIDEAAGVAVADYVKAVTSIKVNGSALRSTAGVINEDGSFNLAAEVNFHGNKTVVFPEAGDYTVEVSASGYPTVSGTVTKSEEQPTSETAEPTTEATEPTSETAEPATETTEPATEVTQPASETVAPATEATEPTTVKPAVKKSANTVKVTVKKASNKVKLAKVKKGKVTIKNVIKVTKAKGTVSYTKASGSKALKVTKKGYVTVAKGTKKGTYTIKIKVTAKGNSKYKKKTVTTKKIKVKVVK